MDFKLLNFRAKVQTLTTKELQNYHKIIFWSNCKKVDKQFEFCPTVKCCTVTCNKFIIYVNLANLATSWKRSCIVAYHHQGWEVILAWNLHRCHWKCYWQYYCCPLRSRSVQHWLETLPHQQSRPQWSPLINGPLKLVCLKGHCFQSPKNCLYFQFPEKERKIDHYTFQIVSREEIPDFRWDFSVFRTL